MRSTGRTSGEGWQIGLERRTIFRNDLRGLNSLMANISRLISLFTFSFVSRTEKVRRQQRNSRLEIVLYFKLQNKIKNQVKR